jgi:diguanylate cyclase (GGDEF)-like protein/PAS domain S-box-containing protein
MEENQFSDLHWLLDVIQSSNVGIVVLDRELRVEVFNRFMQAHSGIRSDQAIGESIFELFPEVSRQWLERRVQSVFDLEIPIYTTWTERPWVFHFPLRLPIHYQADTMYQNLMFVPLQGAKNAIERVGIVVYDVTEIANARRELELAQVDLLWLSRTDRLTQLWSRGYWEERLHEEFMRAQRFGEPVTLVMFDIDHFKRINDTYGHPTGDEAIRLVARLLRECSREIDICGRYGGEEFTAILPGTPNGGAFYFCERLRQRIEAASIAAPLNQTVTFTSSFGIAELNDETADVKMWLEHADQALYRAKTSGRNRTCVYE